MFGRDTNDAGYPDIVVYCTSVDHGCNSHYGGTALVPDTFSSWDLPGEGQAMFHGDILTPTTSVANISFVVINVM